jgi:hypothetical protein
MTATMNIISATLTPLQRWHAARQSGGSIITQRWLIVAGLVAIIVLTVLLIVASFRRRTEDRKTSDRRFFEFADRIGLTRLECQILRDIAIEASLRHEESIFSMIEAFDRGASGIIENTLALQGVDASKRLSAVVSDLREKLGFEKQHTVSVGSVKLSSKPSSKRIPVGRYLHLTCPSTNGPADMKATVIQNNDVQLTIRLASPLPVISGGLCCVRYCFGGSVWEFDTTVVSRQDDVLGLRHSDNIRFINRRRFIRVPVHKPAFIAHFPFVRTLKPKSGTSEDDQTTPADIDDDSWGTLSFVPAVVTELAGPGMRVHSPLEVKTGERVLVIINLGPQDSEPGAGHPLRDVTRIASHEERTTIRIVEDIGEVRHTQAIEGGFSTGLELTGLSDLNVNELIRVINATAAKANGDTQEMTASGGEDNELLDPEPAFAGWRDPSTDGEM